MPFSRTFTASLCATVLITLTPHPLAADPAALELGRRVFLELSEPKCAVCHTLADAGTSGEVGPDLDSIKPDAARVKAAVTNGIGIMPANDGLTPEQVDAVAFYVSSVAGKK